MKRGFLCSQRKKCFSYTIQGFPGDPLTIGRPPLLFPLLFQGQTRRTWKNQFFYHSGFEDRIARYIQGRATRCAKANFEYAIAQNAAHFQNPTICKFRFWTKQFCQVLFPSGLYPIAKLAKEFCTDLATFSSLLVLQGGNLAMIEFFQRPLKPQRRVHLRARKCSNEESNLLFRRC